MIISPHPVPVSAQSWPRHSNHIAPIRTYSSTGLLLNNNRRHRSPSNVNCWSCHGPCSRTRYGITKDAGRRPLPPTLTYSIRICISFYVWRSEPLVWYQITHHAVGIDLEYCQQMQIVCRYGFEIQRTHRPVKENTKPERMQTRLWLGDHPSSQPRLHDRTLCRCQFLLLLFI